MKKPIVLLLGVLALVARLISAEPFNPQRAMEFIEQSRNTPSRQPNLLRIYWKGRVLRELQKPFDAAAYVEYVQSLQNPDGGFGLWPKDVSTPEATQAALTILAQAKAGATNPTACTKYLNSTLAKLYRVARRYHDLEIQRDVYRCLMSLSLLGKRPGELEKYLKILEQDDQPWGMYYRLSAGRAFGQKPVDSKAQIKRLNELTAERYVKNLWRGVDKHYALEVMHLLGGKFTDPDSIRKSTRWLDEEPWGFASAWRKIRMAKLLGVKTPWVESWLKKSDSIKPKPVGGYAAMPGMDTDLSATLLVRRLQKGRGKTVAVPQMATRWQGKPRKEGYYLFFLEKEPSTWFTKQTEERRLAMKIEQTWEAVASLSLASAEPADRKALLRWLNNVLVKHQQDLSIQSFLCALECFEILGASPEHTDELIQAIRGRFSADPQAVRALKVLSARPKSPKAGQDLTRFLDRTRVLAIPMEVSLLAAKFEALDALGEDYSGCDYYLDLLGRLQNPDGGVRLPMGVHSNLFDTIAAIQLAERLEKIGARFDKRRKAGLVIRPRKTNGAISIDGKLSEWKQAPCVRFEEKSDRPRKNRNSTVAYAMWDDKYLYLAFRVRDTNLQAQVQDRDGKVWLDDGIEFLIDPHLDRTRTYLPDDICIHINILGAVLDDRGTWGGRYDFSWNSKVQSAFQRTGTLNDASDEDTGYTAEVALPWSDLNIQGSSIPERIGINFCVNDRDDKKDGYRYSDWAESRVFHVPRNWGVAELTNQGR